MRRYAKSVPARVVFISFLFFFIVFISSTASAQEEGKAEITDPKARLKMYDEHVAMKERSVFRIPGWNFIGPTNISGRITDVAVNTPKGKSYSMYVAAASGGVWKTVNEGITWEPVFEHAASTSIGNIAIAPSNQDIVWIGSGEANIFRSSMAGCGVYKSVDAGESWQHMGLAGTHTIPRIVIHPENPDIVYVASSGHEWTDNEERGVYKTTDGGKSWSKVLYIGEKTGAIDLVMDPSDSSTLYAATWQRKRLKWNDPRNEAGFNGSSIYRTEDGGRSWDGVTNGLPPVEFRGRIGIDISMSNPSVLYAFIDNYEDAHPESEKDKEDEEEKEKEGEEDGEDEQEEEVERDSYGRPRGATIKGATVYRTDDRGETWKQVSEEGSRYMEYLSATYGWVFGQIRVDPADENRIYVMGLALNVSNDGGKTFERLRGMHGDHHGLWIDPENTDYLLNAHDGGVSVSYDGGKNWKNFTDNLPIVQFYNVGFDMDEPFHVYGSIQDHGSRRGVVELGRGRDRIPATEWEYAPGGEASSHAIDPTDPEVVYSEGFYGNISRSDLASGDRTGIMPKAGEDEPDLRGQWLAPFIISPHNPRIIYHGLNRLYRSMNRGDSWEAISNDLTYNDEKKVGDIPYQTIFAISESPLKFGLIYVGTDDGRVHVTEDSGQSWREIAEGLPHGKWISRIVASAYDADTVYMTQNGKRDDDFAAYVWKSTDRGSGWEDISNNIPCGPVNVIREDPHEENILYVGTDLGVYVSVNKGGEWHTLATDLPTAYVHDLAIHPRDNILVAATHGRGMYALDVELIRKLDEEVLAEEAAIIDTSAGSRPKGRWGRARPARICYYMKEPGQVTIVISDESGKVLNTLEEEGGLGLNTAYWNLTAKKKKKEAGEEKGEPEETERGRRGTEKKKYADPGKYKVKLIVGDTEREAEVEVE